jgi:hypothetical protein
MPKGKDKMPMKEKKTDMMPMKNMGKMPKGSKKGGCKGK